MSPRSNERTKEKSRIINRASDRIRNMGSEERWLYFRKIEVQIAREEMESYKASLGEKRTLAKIDRNYITNGFVYKN